MTTSAFIDASEAPPRATGQIKLHGPEAFEGMRKAGKLAADISFYAFAVAGYQVRVKLWGK